MHGMNMEHLLANLLWSLSISRCTLVDLSHALMVVYSEGLQTCNFSIFCGLVIA